MQNSVFAESFSLQDYYQEQLESSSESLLSISGWEKAKKQIDTFFEAHGENVEVMSDLDERMWDIQDKIYFEGADEKTTAIVEYMSAKIDIAFNEGYEAEVSLEKEKIQQRVSETFVNSLSESENQKANRRILQLQNVMLEHGNSTLDKMIWEFEKYTKIQEEWDLVVEASIDQDSIILGNTISGDVSLSIQDYISKTDVFDSEFHGKLEGNVSMKSQDDTFIEAAAETFFSIIQKDGIMYLWVKDTEVQIQWEQLEEELSLVKDYVDFINTNMPDDTYVRIWDEATAEIFKRLHNIQPEQLFWAMKLAVEYPFFEAYTKKWDEYLLKPTQHLCSTLKSVIGVFDPFFWKECSSSQYQDFLWSFLEIGGQLSLTSKGLNNNTLKYTWVIDEEVSFISEVQYNSIGIQTININVTPDQDRYPNEGIDFTYIQGERLWLDIRISDIELLLDSTLKKDSSIQTMNGSISIEGTQVAFLKIQRERLEAGIDYTMTEYDWFTWETQETYKFFMNAEWALSNGVTSSLDMHMDIQDLQDTDNYWEFELQYGIGQKNKINGSMLLVEEGVSVVTWDMQWLLKKDYADIQSKIMINDDIIWEIDFDIMYDLRNNTANSDVWLSVDIENMLQFNIELQNTGTRKPFEGVIEAPEKYIDINDLLFQQ